MRSSKYTEHYTDTFITFKEIMRTVSNIYHNCVPDKIKNRRNTDQLKQRDTVIIACVIWGIINGYTSQRATYRAVCSVLFLNRIRQKSPILYRWVMNAVRYEGYRW
ncbi:hypothetical protein DVY30_13465 [Enterococcus faecium]|nr:hypothetical protein DVY30_13465 [Enterococcus faecium]